MTDAPKCPHCACFAFEPEHHPLKPCTACGGTGRPTADVPAFLTSGKQKELLDNG